MCSCARPTRRPSTRSRSPSRSRSASPAGNVGFALAGGGSESTNIILTTVDAYVAGSSLGTTASRIGSLTLTATSTATIEAFVAAVAASVSFGGKVGVGVALGVSVARNFIGWDPHETVAADHSSNAYVLALTPGETVRIASGVRSGDVYEYVGPAYTVPFGHTSASGSQALSTGDVVKRLPGSGHPDDEYYEYLGGPGTVDLGTTIYGNVNLWRSVDAPLHDYFGYTTAAGSVSLQSGDVVKRPAGTGHPDGRDLRVHGRRARR